MMSIYPLNTLRYIEIREKSDKCNIRYDVYVTIFPYMSSVLRKKTGVLLDLGHCSRPMFGHFLIIRNDILTHLLSLTWQFYST